MESNENYKDDLLKRLKRIEGQVKGVQRMVEEEKYCADILIQVAAIRAAINKVGGLILQNHSKTCIKKAVNADSGEEAMDELIDIVLKFIK
ncbi:MAG: CsoR family transcriptional regulator, copper-sensing transcriptional repressor [Clostridiales bacterium]|jgi:DNA-binding FrmR family transcriptional regulator|nr:CsoR family transcriptional regulator, copper-sensing transcriptional repressor [Clostridiales bacterium]MDK2934060.1 CsoR family transcriptional regulator, copper-sensing transcriptional repressor [Clostridiales bacterium]